MTRKKHHRVRFSSPEDFPDFEESAKTADLTQDQFESTVPSLHGKVTAKQGRLIDQFAKRGAFNTPEGVKVFKYKTKSGKAQNRGRAEKDVTVRGKKYKKGQFVRGSYRG